MNIVISALHFAWQDIRGCLAVAERDMGLDGVELSWHESFSRPHCTAQDIDLLASLRDEHSMLLSAHIWNNLAESDPVKARGDLLRWLQVCGRTNVMNIVIHGGSFEDQKESVARTRRVLEDVLPEFERKGVVLNLENHYAYDYRNCRELFSASWEFVEVLTLDSPSLKMCFDTGHGNMTGTTTDLLETLAPWLNYVHLADNHGVDDDHTPYGQGTVVWADIFRDLRRLGFNGTYCVEFPVYHDRAPFNACIEAIRENRMDANQGVQATQ